MRIDQSIIDSAQLNDEQMEQLLLEFIDTQYCSALMRYINQRTEVVFSSLTTTDPNKEPTNIARAQGIRSGLLDIVGLLRHVEERSLKTDKEE